MSDFLHWFLPRAFVVALLVAIVYLSFRVQRWRFDECVSVGHSRAYCTSENPLGAHREQ